MQCLPWNKSKTLTVKFFPAYIKEIKSFGVTHYEAYVTDGHIDCHGANDHTAKVPAKYAPLAIAENSRNEEFKEELIAHQQGKPISSPLSRCARHLESRNGQSQ